MPAGQQPVFYYVDPTEEIASVLRGIKTAKSNQVAVVLPREPRLFRNDVNLRLMAAYAREGDKEVALITTDRGVARVAGEHGLRVYTSPDLAWQPEGRVICNDLTEPQEPVFAIGNSVEKDGGHRFLGRQRIVALSCALFAAALLLYAFMPHVTVVVTPATHKIERQLNLALVAEGTTGNGVILHMAESMLTAEGSAPATGHRIEGVAAATGTVMLFNETNKSVHIPVGTVIGTDGGHLFKTTKSVDVPPVKPEYFMEVPVGMKAGQAEVPVQSTKPGTVGNVAAGRLKTMPNGPVGIKVINPEAMHGGADRNVTYVTQADVDVALKQATAKLQAQAEQAIKSSAGTDAHVILTLLEVTPGQISITPSVDQEAKTVSVTMKGHAQAPYVLQKDVRKAVAAQADTLVPTGYKRMGTPEVAALTPVSPVGDRQAPDSLTVTASIPVGSTVDPATIAGMLVGMTPAQATKALVDSGEVSEAVVQGKPRKRLPRWTPWIRVVVADPVGLVAQ